MSLSHVSRREAADLSEMPFEMHGKCLSQGAVSVAEDAQRGQIPQQALLLLDWSTMRVMPCLMLTFQACQGLPHVAVLPLS